MSHEKWLISPGRVKTFLHSRGKRVSPEFLRQVNFFLEHKLEVACLVHNGGKKTLDREIAAYVGMHH